MNENDKKALNRITKQAANVTQSELSSIDDLYCNIVTKKVKCIMANSCHALHDYAQIEADRIRIHEANITREHLNSTRTSRNPARSPKLPPFNDTKDDMDAYIYIYNVLKGRLGFPIAWVFILALY